MLARVLADRLLVRALLVTSVLSVLTPVLLHVLLPVPEAGSYAARVDAWVAWSRAFGLLLAAGAVGLVLLQGRRDAAGARRDATVIALTGLLVGVAAVPHVIDDASAGALHHKYTRDDRLTDAHSGLNLRSFHAADAPGAMRPLLFDFTGGMSADTPVRLGPYPAEKGDAWEVRATIHDPSRTEFHPPTLVASDHVRCEVSETELQTYRRNLDDGLHEKRFYEASWACVATEAGDVTFHLSEAPGATETRAGAGVYPTFRLHYLQTLDGSLVRVGAALAAGGLFLLVHRAHFPAAGRGSNRDRAAAFTGLGVTAFTWSALVWWTAYGLVDDPLTPDRAPGVQPLLAGWTVVAVATGVLAFAAARAWRSERAPLAVDLGRLAALGSTLALSLGPLLPLGFGTLSSAVAFAHMGAGALIAGLAVQRAWTGVPLLRRVETPAGDDVP